MINLQEDSKSKAIQQSNTLTMEMENQTLKHNHMKEQELQMVSRLSPMTFLQRPTSSLIFGSLILRQFTTKNAKEQLFVLLLSCQIFTRAMQSSEKVTYPSLNRQPRQTETSHLRSSGFRLGTNLI